MAERITSVQNQRVKNAVRLRDRHGRDDQQRIIIDGAREILRAIQAGVQVTEVYAVLDEVNETEEQVLAAAEQGQALILDMTPAVMSKLAYGDRHSGLVAVARAPKRSLADLSIPPSAVVAVLEQIEKPGNLGAVVRSADAAGLSAVIVSDARTDLYNPNAIRASSGTIFSLPVVTASTEATLQWLRAERFQIYSSRVDAAEVYWNTPFADRTALIFGSESQGLSKVWTGADIHEIRVPQQGAADSLNVSVTAALLFYEVLRQRDHSADQ